MSDYVRADKQILVAVFGIASSLLTGIILALIKVYTGFAFYSLSFWFIIPVGAFLAGFGGASGYYAGAKLFQQKPVGGVLLNMVAASVSTFVLVYYIPYFMLEVEGHRVKDIISFWQYLDFTFAHTSLKLVGGSTSTGELGSLGYVHAVLQLIGFSIGGVAVFGWLSENPYCKKCSRYLQWTGKQDRYWMRKESLTEDMEKFTTLVESQKLSEAVRLHNEELGMVAGDAAMSSRLITRVCKGCGINHLSFVISRRKKDDWKDIEETRLAMFYVENEDESDTVLAHISEWVQIMRKQIEEYGLEPGKFFLQTMREQHSAETSNVFRCPHCGADFDPEDYRQDAPEWHCAQCCKTLPKELLGTYNNT